MRGTVDWHNQNNWSDGGKTNMSPGEVNTDPRSGPNRSETIRKGANPFSTDKPDSKAAAEAVHKRHLGGPLPDGSSVKVVDKSGL